MEAMNLVEVVLNQGNEEENEISTYSRASTGQSSPIKGLDESVTITVTRTPGKSGVRGGKPANFAMLSSPVPMRNGKYPNAESLSPKEEMTCTGCQRVFKYKAAYLRHESQCGVPDAVRLERIEKAAEEERQKALEVERQKMVELERHQVEKQKLPELRCPICSKQFSANDSFKDHDFNACAEERKSYTFICRVCKAKFKYKNHLRRHEDSHNNVRRYNCDVCTTAFLRPDHLKRHMIRMHGIVQLPSQNAPKNTPMQCPQCSKILSRRDHLLRHMRNVHNALYEPRFGAHFSSLLVGLMLSKQNNYDNYQNDEDGSEDLSMTSDNLMIDESFESVKNDCESPTQNRNVGKDGPRKQFYNESQSHDLSMKPGGYNHFVEALPARSEIRTVDCNTGNQTSRGNENVSPYFSSGCGQGPRKDTEKPGNSDGNQNVLGNGHAARGAGNDWISNVPNYSGW
ncbi:hypothetical protein ONE63_003959 [Megalurothrips usitatus]|uniref:C2H2-type domain-containing protein n=1 Tax=Megalurothrips usitatus TaxID=439358 RepID=A0AAV7XAM8_9NEOP|nr:hypothetical protein ONE63_003959 [Megalurothrips usitatus]